MAHERTRQEMHQILEEDCKSTGPTAMSSARAYAGGSLEKESNHCVSEVAVFLPGCISTGAPVSMLP
jgi:hypothetical protein